MSPLSMEKLYTVESMLRNCTELGRWCSESRGYVVSLSVVSWESFSKSSDGGEIRERNGDLFGTRGDKVDFDW